LPIAAELFIVVLLDWVRVMPVPTPAALPPVGLVWAKAAAEQVINSVVNKIEVFFMVVVS